MIVADAKRHQLIEGQLVGRIRLEQFRAGGGELQTLAHDGGGNAEGRRNCFQPLPRLGERLERAELIERVQRLAHHVFGKAVFLGEPVRLDDAGDGSGFRQLLLFDEELQRLEATPAGRDFEHAGLLATCVRERADAQGLQQAAALDIGGEHFNRLSGLLAADVGLRQNELIKGNVPGCMKRQFGLSHGRGLLTSRGRSHSPLTFNSSPETQILLSLFNSRHGLAG